MRHEVRGQHVVVSGEMSLGAATMVELSDDLHALVRAHSTVSIDLAVVSFVDSTGLGVIVAAAREARAAGNQLRITAFQPSCLGPHRADASPRRPAAAPPRQWTCRHRRVGRSANTSGFIPRRLKS